MQQGIVKWFDEKKGFGFIESNGSDYFAHFKAIKQQGFKTLVEGQKVEFVPFKGVKGMEAHDITMV